MLKKIIPLIISLTSLDLALAQHPIEVQKKAASGDYMAALATYRQMPARRATAETAVAAGKSAWALGLTEVAKQEFDKALQIATVDDTISQSDKARIIFSRGIIEFQEGNYQASLVFAEKAVKLVKHKGPLRSEIHQLIGENFIKLNKPVLAEEHLVAAIDGAREQSEGDLRFILGSTQMQLGRLKEAKENLELIPLRHEKGPAALRALATIAFESERYEEVLFWLTKGRDEFPDSFLDSWVDYALVRSHGKLNQREELTEIYEAALKRYPPSDSWLILLQAAAEEYLWQQDRNVQGS